MTTENSNSGIVGTTEAEVGHLEAGGDASNNSRLHQRSDAAHRAGKSPQWAWAVCRSEYDWMDMHLPFFTSEWF
ncbi:hypothetical protein M3I54_37905 [Paraburkholderia sp. CNPSo 3274]|uniref:hypothetical protein n=1 Tax=Paraburkholderia sp. CNPSo 3274 TaxID=2940932 RepID=UPI0020B77BB0|nr:hypothetical protein [Paraburkholderia sp. CNPSo 3274]MCP3712630.1 hypothetical protein [Paraburkholderia sp. CNPSo 3274]